VCWRAFEPGLSRASLHPSLGLSGGACLTSSAAALIVSRMGWMLPSFARREYRHAEFTLITTAV
jgi:hypothetical protein